MRINLALGIAVFLTTGLAAQAASAQEACSPPRYAASLAEASASARASIRLAAIKGASDELRNQLGANSSVNGRISGRYSVWAAAELAEGAYGDTLRSYFCELKRAFAGNPARVAILDAQERSMRLELNSYYDIGLWEPGSEASARRTARREALLAAPASPALIPRADVIAAMPTFTFDQVRLRQINVDGGVTDPSGNAVASVGVCGGWVRRSIRKLEPSVLASLELMRETIIDWLSGKQADAKIDMWIFTSQYMGRQLSTANQVEPPITVTPAFLTCLDEAAAVVAAPQPSA